MDEELDEERLKLPEAAKTLLLEAAVADDDHWWQIRTTAVEIEHQDIEAEFVDPPGLTDRIMEIHPTYSHRPKSGRMWRRRRQKDEMEKNTRRKEKKRKTRLRRGGEGQKKNGPCSHSLLF